MVRERKPPSATWRAFLDNHVKDLVAIDFFVVPTATFGVLFGFLVLAHDCRPVLHFNVNSEPDGGVDGAAAGCSPSRRRRPLEVHRARPRPDLRRASGAACWRILGVEEVVTAAIFLVAELIRGATDRFPTARVPGPRSHPRRGPSSPGCWLAYFGYYNRSRCHLSLAGDAPVLEDSGGRAGAGQGGPSCRRSAGCTIVTSAP